MRKIESSLFKADKLMKDNRIEKERKKDDRKEKEGRKEKDERKEKGRMTKEIPVKILGMTKETGTNYFIVRHIFIQDLLLILKKQQSLQNYLRFSSNREILIIF